MLTVTRLCLSVKVTNTRFSKGFESWKGHSVGHTVKGQGVILFWGVLETYHLSRRLSEVKTVL